MNYTPWKKHGNREQMRVTNFKLTLRNRKRELDFSLRVGKCAKVVSPLLIHSLETHKH